jgi:hypothetical protein
VLGTLSIFLGYNSYIIVEQLASYGSPPNIFFEEEDCEAKSPTAIYYQ